MVEKTKILNATKRWLERFVIERNLCPFAKGEYLSNNIRFFISAASQEDELLETLFKEIQFLVSHADISTTLVIHPECLIDFDQYNQFLDLTEGLLEQEGWSGEYQIASFHPDYQFSNTQPDDAENYTNRSPYPILHILRESQVEKAIKSYPEIEQISIRNIKLMNQIGSNVLQSELMDLQK